MSRDCPPIPHTSKVIWTRSRGLWDKSIPWTIGVRALNGQHLVDVSMYLHQVEEPPMKLCHQQLISKRGWTITNLLTCTCLWNNCSTKFVQVDRIGTTMEWCNVVPKLWGWLLLKHLSSNGSYVFITIHGAKCSKASQNDLRNVISKKDSFVTINRLQVSKI